MQFNVIFMASDKRKYKRRDSLFSFFGLVWFAFAFAFACFSRCDENDPNKFRALSNNLNNTLAVFLMNAMYGECVRRNGAAKVFQTTCMPWVDMCMCASEQANECAVNIQSNE